MIKKTKFKKLINKYNCYRLHFTNLIIEINYNELILRDDKNSLLSQINKNSIIIILGENFFVIPKLALLQWGYFKAIINNWTSNIDSINECIICIEY